jgi:hypothetical protein
VTISDDEARTIAGLLAEADDGCVDCVAAWVCRFDRAIPWIPWADLAADESDGAFTPEELRERSPCRKAEADVGRFFAALAPTRTLVYGG